MVQLVDIPNVGRVEFPDGMTPDDITKAIHNDILKTPTQDQGSTIGNFATGVGRGVKDLGQGLKQLGLGALGTLGVTSPDSQNNYTKQVDEERRQYDMSPAGQSTAGNVGRFAGNVLPTIAIPGGIAGSLATRMGTGALAGAGLGATQYVPEYGSRALNTGIGGLLGGAAPVATGLLAKGYNTVKGNVIDPAAQSIIDLGKKWGVRIGASDASNSSLIKNIDQGLEEIPVVGTRGFRAGQNEEAKTAAQSLLNDYQKKMLDTGFKDMVNLQNVSKSRGSRSQKAQELLNDIANTGDDWQKNIEISGRAKLLNQQLVADKKYGLVEELADKYGAVPTINTLGTLDDVIKSEKASSYPDKSLLNFTTQMRNNISNGQYSYSQLRKDQSRLGKIIEDSRTGSNALVGSNGAGAIQEIKSAIRKDMDTFAQSSDPQLSKAWKEADNFYKNEVIPYKDAQLAKSLSNGAPDEIYSKFITSGGEEGGKGTTRALRLYNALDSKGQSAVRYGMTKNAFDKAYNPDTGSFSPAKFASEFDKIAAAKGVFFQGSAKAEIDGFKNLMRHAERSNVAINKPETGVRAIPYLVGGALAGGAYIDPSSTLGILTSAYGLKKLMTTPAGRNFLLSSSQFKAGSPQMQKALDKFISTIQLGSVQGTLQNISREDK